MRNKKNYSKKIIYTKHMIQSLASYVQNDFERMLSDGTIDITHLKNSLVEVDEAYDVVIEHLNVMRSRSKHIMSEYINEH